MPRVGYDALPSADRAVNTYNSSDIAVPHWAKGVQVETERTTGTGTLTITIQGKVANAAVYYTLLASAAAQTSSRIVVYPGVTSSANLKENSPLPETIRVSVAVATANATFSSRVIFVA